MENLDLIDRYFENSLSPKEQKLFNDLLQNNSDFKEEYLFQKDLKKVIKISQHEELKSTLSQIEEKADNNYGFTMIPKKWMIAASLAIIATLGVWGIKSLFYPSNEAIFEEYFQADRNTVHPVVRGEIIKTIENRAFAAYEAQDYYKAINLFNSVKNPNDAYILYYKGLCFLALDKKEEAITLLKQVGTSIDSENDSINFNEKANWYLALAYLKKDNIEQAISQLTEIRDNPNSSFKKQEVQEILNYLQ